MAWWVRIVVEAVCALFVFRALMGVAAGLIEVSAALREVAWLVRAREKARTGRDPGDPFPTLLTTQAFCVQCGAPVDGRDADPRCAECRAAGPVAPAPTP